MKPATLNPLFTWAGLGAFGLFAAVLADYVPNTAILAISFVVSLMIIAASYRIFADNKLLISAYVSLYPIFMLQSFLLHQERIHSIMVYVINIVFFCLLAVIVFCTVLSNLSHHKT